MRSLRKSPTAARSSPSLIQMLVEQSFEEEAKWILQQLRHPAGSRVQQGKAFGVVAGLVCLEDGGPVGVVGEVEARSVTRWHCGDGGGHGSDHAFADGFEVAAHVHDLGFPGGR